MSEWKNIQFGKLYKLPSRNGLNRPSAVRGEGYKMINMGELFANDRIGAIEMERVKLNENEKKNFDIQKYDLLFARQSMVAEGAGKCSIVIDVPELTCFESHLIRVRLSKENASPIFYYYLFQSSLGKALLSSIRLQGVQAGIKGTDLVKLEVPFPHLSEQHRIASILSTYDELIENNYRRIAILEQTAEQIYKEWFVRMRFPGYENAEFEKGVPKDWKIMTIEKAFKYQAGGTPSKEVNSYWQDGNINWYTPTDITGSKSYFLNESSIKCTELGVSKSSAKIFPAYSLMMTSRATIGEIGINTTAACTNQGFITCLPNKAIPLTFLFHWLKLNKSYFVTISTGATFAELTKSAFKRISILIPNQEIVNKFDTIVKPIFNQIENLQNQNQNLKQTRDLLLPRLISGKLKVKEAEKEIETV